MGGLYMLSICQDRQDMKPGKKDDPILYEHISCIKLYPVYNDI